MRGTLIRMLPDVRPTGIIPAYAGNTRCCWPSCWCCRDHPRVCGEHKYFAIAFAPYSGSSPRMRGTLWSIFGGDWARGIIPAYAGNTLTLIWTTLAFRDHPRVCGEHPCRIFCELSVSGSSPRMRGTPIGQCMTPFDTGIIPAYAGNTMSSDLTLKNLRDHPRVCGEHPRPMR